VVETGEVFTPWKQFLGSLVPEWLERRQEVHPIGKLLYGRLMRYAGQDGKAFPRQATLASDIGVTTSTVQKHLKKLKDLGLIRVRQRGLNGPNEYFFLTHPWNLGLMDRKRSAPEPVEEPVPQARQVEPDPPEMVDIRESDKESPLNESQKKENLQWITLVDLPSWRLKPLPNELDLTELERESYKNWNTTAKQQGPSRLAKCLQ
jgi:DNA-binding transcriptional MocR family regulator